MKRPARDPDSAAAMVDPDLAPNDLPLQGGVHLLEASAGTGKTFTLAHLVLRLVAERGLELGQLLVVTFTEAAAAELRDRIGRRLQEALNGLGEGGAPGIPVEPDPVLKEWLQRHGPERTPGLRARLLLALEQLDAADITTIHGFCRRTLQRQALEAGLGPGVELEPEGATLVAQVVHDYTEASLLRLPDHLLEGLRARGVKPDQLAPLLTQLEGDPALQPPPLPPGWTLEIPLDEQLTRQWQTDWQRFGELWRSRGAALEQTLRQAAADLRSRGLEKTSPYSPRPRNDRAALLDAWLADQPDNGSYAAVLSGKANWLADYFHPGAFSQACAPLEGPHPSLPDRPLMDAVAALVDGPAEAVLSHFCHWGLGELRQRRARSGRMSYGDLLLGLDPGPQASAPSELIAAIRGRYQAALIDEFQDTDPIQWRILRAAFLPQAGEPGPAHLLVMVGDPKQAIYRFRGGDLATYLAARRTAAELGGVHRLRRNFRSSVGLLAGLNGLMRPGLVRSTLEVPEVLGGRGEGRGELLLAEGEAALQLLWLGSDRAAGEAAPSRSQLEKVLPPRVAALVLQLLRRGLRLRRAGGERPLEPADVCLLVQSHAQAEALRAALEQRGIASRLVSQGDVFAGEGATLLQRLLDALAEPGSGVRQRLLAASPLLGWSPRRIAAAGPAEWDRLADRLARLAAGLAGRGLLATLGDLLGGDDLARLSLSGRLLADLQQCAELVQVRLHQERLGATAAADWLRRRRHHPPDTVPEEHLPHSSAVTSAVAVLTVHRSKGLEFPVVICPYLWQAGRDRGRRGLEARRWTPPGTEEPRLVLHLDPRWGDGLNAYRQERDALDQEAERLAYVAATRAMDLLVLGFVPAAGQATNPLFPWLYADETPPGRDGADPYTERGDADWLALLEQGIGRRRLPLELVVAPLEPAAGLRWCPPPPPGTPGTGPVPSWPLSGGWGRSSYSSWTHAAAGLGPKSLEEGRDTDNETDTGGEMRIDLELPWSTTGPLADFPRGPGAGDCLHRILEQVDHRQPGDTPAHAELVQRELSRAGLPPTLLAPVLAFLEQLRLTPMGGALAGFRLADLSRERRLNEMNFDLPLAIRPDAPAGAGSADGGTRSPRPLVRATALAAVFRRHPPAGLDAAYAERLACLEVASRGFLTGSIDLIFTAPDPAGRPRWWVADWKSNWLGERTAEGLPLRCGPCHYGPQAMAELMAHHHYPLQANLYLVALHRYLRWRLPDYRPERDLGGSVYVFLRGVPGPLEHGGRPDGPVPGMAVEPAMLERIEALDTLLREGVP